jgi:hypothetical protein
MAIFRQLTTGRTDALEEACAETIATLAATLKHQDQDEFSGQIEELVALGLTRKEESSLVLTKHGRNALRT